MKVIVDFLTDSAKIVFGSAIIGFFIPGISGAITIQAFVGGVFTTIVFLTTASLLDKRVSNHI
ncbi:MAG: hypothetical protein AAB522_03075 [Patescibacteria group bacterium]